MVVRLEGDLRKNLELLRVTPRQAGVLLFLRRHADATLTDVATALRLRLPTMSTLVKDLVRKRWVLKRRSVKARRALSLWLSRRGKTLALQIGRQVQQIQSTLAKQDRCAIGAWKVSELEN